MKKRRGMDLYTNGGNIRLGNCRRWFTSLTMYNLHIFYLAPLMFSRSSHFLISGLHAGNTKIKGQPHWVVLLDLCQSFSSMHDYCFLPCMWPQVITTYGKTINIYVLVTFFTDSWRRPWGRRRTFMFLVIGWPIFPPSSPWRAQAIWLASAR